MKCRCECKEDLINKMVCDKCECGKSCGIGQYLDYKGFVCKNSLVDKLVEECTSVIDGNAIYNKTLTAASSNDCTSSTQYVVLFAVFLSTSLIISGAFIYYHWYKNKQLGLKKDVL